MDNVFADIGVPDAAEYLVKADLARTIINAIREQRLSQFAAAKRLGIGQPQLALIEHGILTSFSVEQLTGLAIAA